MTGGLFVAASVLVFIALEALAAWVTGNPTCGCLPCILTQDSGGAFIPSNSGPLPEGMKRVCLLASRPGHACAHGKRLAPVLAGLARLFRDCLEFRVSGLGFRV